MQRPARIWAHLALFVPVAAWAASLALPALSARGGPTLTGFDLLLEGWQGAPRGVIAWYANPVWICAVVAAASRRPLVAGLAAGLAVVLALTTFAVDEILAARMSSVPELTLRGGFYLWLLALIATFLWSWVCVYLQQRDNRRGAVRRSKPVHTRD